MLNENIILKEYITDKDYREINELEKLCLQQDKVNLKLELDYRMGVIKNTETGLKEINEFFYYVDDVLAAYLGISSFGGSNIGEVNGVTHPDFRRKGFFKKIFQLAMEECKKRNFNKILLLTDGNSESGIKFINFVCGEYAFSEYRMKLNKKTTLEKNNSITLRQAEKKDLKEISIQNAVFFYEPEVKEEISVSEQEFVIEDTANEITYMIELDKNTIGKLRITYYDSSAFISGFGIKSDYRGKGYGKAALIAALHLINERNIYEVELDVEGKNSTALNLYKACDFEMQSEMNYYKHNL